MSELFRSTPQEIPTIEEALALPLALEATVEARFIDDMGHMNVSWYVHLFDRATWALFRRVGIDDEYQRRAHAGMFAVEHHIRYLGELREGDPLEVHGRLLAASPRSVRLQLLMTDPARQRLAAAAEVVGVHIDMNTRRSTPFPAPLAERLRAEAGTASSPGATHP